MSELHRRFWTFHLQNPEVYDTLVRLTREWKELTGQGRGSINMLFEVARWQTGLRMGGEPYKMNNDYRSRYARLIMQREYDLDGFFEIRALAS